MQLRLFLRDKRARFLWRFRAAGHKQVSKWRYFRDVEVDGLDTELVAKLDMARHMCEFPFLITSGKRTPDQNERVGGVQSSSHLTGRAVDLMCHGSVARYKMLRALFTVGFQRIGIYQKHIHVDLDHSKPQVVAWLEEYKD